MDTLVANRHHLLMVVVLVIAVVLAHVGGLHGEFISDDKALIAENSKLDSPQFIIDSFTKNVWANAAVESADKSLYRPVYLTWYYLIHEIGGKSPLPFHIGNLVLHVLNTCLAVVLAGLLVPGSAMSHRVAGAAVFALHPVNSGTVAWISGGTDLLIIFFAFIAFYCFLADQNERRGYLLPAGLLAYAMALLTKETAIMLLPLMFAQHSLQSQGDKGYSAKPWFVGLAIITALYLAIRYMVLVEPDKDSALAFNIDGVFRFFEYSCLAARFAMLPWPLPFYFQYPLQGIADTWEWIVGASVIAGAVVLYLRIPIARFAILWFVLMLLPTLGLAFHPFGTFALRFLYGPTFALGILCTLGLAFLSSARHGRIGVGVVMTVTALFFGLTILEARDFRSSDAFHHKVLSYDPTFAGSYSAIAKLQLGRSDISAAIETYRKGIENVVNDEHRLSLAEDLALLYGRAGHHERSIATYELMLEDEQARVIALGGIANNYWMLRDYDNALHYYRLALQADGENFDALFNFGLLNEQLGRKQEALNAYRELIELPRKPGKDGARRHAMEFIRKEQIKAVP